MKYYLIAGEASGDMYGSSLMKEIKKNDPSAEFRYWGGDMMKAEGGTLVRHYKDHDFMGIVEVLKHLRTIFKNIAFCKQDISDHKPDAIIFIDFPGFNLKIVKHAKELGIKTFYYISPTVWAWKENRVEIIKKYVDHMFCIFPFEKKFYKERHNYDVDFVGHPLLDSIIANTKPISMQDFIIENKLPNKKMIAILPGSRTSEIRENLKTMQELIPDFPDYHFVIAGMSHFDEAFYQQFITNENISVLFNKTYPILQASEAAIVVCGTATLETALLKCPQIIVFKTNPITFLIGKILVKLNYLGLPNIIMNREIVPEYLQKQMNSKTISHSLQNIINNKTVNSQIADNYAELAQTLGSGGASKQTAWHIHNYLTT
jgi:lipid-A-disaccharide synthase